MSDYKVTDTQLTSIANAIRAKTGKSAQIEFPNEFVSEIGSISGGGSGSSLQRDNYILDPNYLDYIETNFDLTLIKNVSNPFFRILLGQAYGHDMYGEDLSYIQLSTEAKRCLYYNFKTASIQCMMLPLKKIPASANTVYITASAESKDSADCFADFAFATSIKVNGNYGGNIQDLLFEVLLSNYNFTAEQINNQQYITFEIPITDHLICPPQTVQIDISGINSDLFLFIFNSKSNLSLRDIHWA